MVRMSLIPCTSQCVYQQDGVCTLEQRRGGGVSPLWAAPASTLSRRTQGGSDRLTDIPHRDQPKPLGRGPAPRSGGTGIRHWVKPSRRTSLIRWPSWLTDRSSPVRPTSPMATRSAGTGRSR